MDDRRPLGSRFQDCCRTTREGGGLPEGPGIPAGITHDLVLLIDLPARRMEREERLLAMHGGDVNKTLADVSREGGGQDARFLLAHGVDANHKAGYFSVLEHAARNAHLTVVEALLDASANRINSALFWAATRGPTALVALLLDCGADVHSFGDSALLQAVTNGHLATSRLFLQRGGTATPNTLVLFAARARQRGHHAVADLLRAHLPL